MSQRSLREGTLTIKEGDGYSVTVGLGDGNITWSEKRNIEYILDRGQISG